MIPRKEYLKLNINQRINERQHRNSLNINFVFWVVNSDSDHSKYENSDHPKINNGIYHHLGKTHSKYPKK